jgi:hypothetical protein
LRYCGQDGSGARKCIAPFCFNTIVAEPIAVENQTEKRQIVEIVYIEETLDVEVKRSGFHNRLRSLKALKNKEKKKIKKVEKRC